jgi:hypothetical protein
VEEDERLALAGFVVADGHVRRLDGLEFHGRVP